MRDSPSIVTSARIARSMRSEERAASSVEGMLAVTSEAGLAAAVKDSIAVTAAKTRERVLIDLSHKNPGSLFATGPTVADVDTCAGRAETSSKVDGPGPWSGGSAAF